MSDRLKVLWFDGEAPNPLRLVLVPDDTDVTTQRAKLAVFDEDLLPDGSVVAYLRVGDPIPAAVSPADTTEGTE